MPLPQSAADHYRDQQRLTVATLLAARRAWRRVGVDFDAGWRTVRGQLVTLVSAAQLAAARSSIEYVPAVLNELDVTAEPAGEVRPQAFAGVASDGRPLDGLLYASITTAKESVGAGATVDQALAAGAGFLESAIRTQLADAERVATGVGIAVRSRVGYVRMLNPPSCSRCAILAGRFYQWNAGFLRHPRCDCRHIPAPESMAGDLTTDPRAYFDSLSVDEQNRIFTTAGARAIRDGADIGQVVNARRGMTTAGTTTEGVSRRGFAGRRLRGRQRLMPERIYAEAGSREEAIDLLRQHGFIA